MRVRDLCRSLAKRLGMVAIAGGISVGLASNGYAAMIAVPDAGFEDHVIDDPSGYAYGAAGQFGDPDVFNNPSSANGGDDMVVVSLYDAGAVTFLPTSIPDLILSEPSLVTATPVITSGPFSDETFMFSAASLAGLAGKNIGIAVYSPDATGQDPRIDDIRLEVTPVPEPGSLVLLGLGGIALAGLRRRK